MDEQQTQEKMQHVSIEEARSRRESLLMAINGLQRPERLAALLRMPNTVEGRKAYRWNGCGYDCIRQHRLPGQDKILATQLVGDRYQAAEFPKLYTERWDEGSMRYAPAGQTGPWGPWARTSIQSVGDINPADLPLLFQYWNIH